MRAYEFAKKVGIDYGSVVQLAEANDIEVYSPLTQFEDDELETLHAAYLRSDRSSFADAAAAIAEKRRNRLQRVIQALASHDRTQMEELEAGRKRALAAAGLIDTAKEVPQEQSAEKRAAVKDLKDLLGGSEDEKKDEKPADAPRISIEVSSPAEEDEDYGETRQDHGRKADEDDEEDDDDELSYLHGKDRRVQPTGKAAKAQRQKVQQQKVQPPPKQPAKPAAKTEEKVPSAPSARWRRAASRRTRCQDRTRATYRAPAVRSPPPPPPRTACSRCVPRQHRP